MMDKRPSRMFQKNEVLYMEMGVWQEEDVLGKISSWIL